MLQTNELTTFKFKNATSVQYTASGYLRNLAKNTMCGQLPNSIHFCYTISPFSRWSSHAPRQLLSRHIGQRETAAAWPEGNGGAPNNTPPCELGGGSADRGTVKDSGESGRKTPSEVRLVAVGILLLSSPRATASEIHDAGNGTASVVRAGERGWVRPHAFHLPECALGCGHTR